MYIKSGVFGTNFVTRTMSFNFCTGDHLTVAEREFRNQHIKRRRDEKGLSENKDITSMKSASVYHL